MPIKLTKQPAILEPNHAGENPAYVGYLTLDRDIIQSLLLHDTDSLKIIIRAEKLQDSIRVTASAPSILKLKEISP
jgi:hypothetical protein